MRNLSKDLAAFRHSLGRIECDLRSRGESASSDQFTEMIERIRSCNAHWSTHQLRVAQAMMRRTEATEAEQSIARELADVLLDVALEVGAAAENPTDEMFTSRNEAWHLLSEVHRHCRPKNVSSRSAARLRRPRSTRRRYCWRSCAKRC